MEIAVPRDDEAKLQEARLIEQARGGDQDAFRQLYDVNVDRVYRLAFRMAGDEDLARDYTQEAFVKAFHKLDQFRGDSAFSTWMHSITVSVTLNGLRKVKRAREREFELDERLVDTKAAAIAEPDLKDRLKAAIDGLPKIYRTVFVMHDLEGYKHEEIAETLKTAVGTSKARLSRARAQLREVLGDLAEEYA